MPEKLEKLHLYICTVAALTVTVVSIIQQVSLYRMSIWVSITIVAFYVIGQFVRLFLIRIFYPQGFANGKPTRTETGTDGVPEDEEHAYAENIDQDE